VAASAGRLAWKAVSKRATAGTPGPRQRDRLDGGERLRLVERRERSQVTKHRQHVGVKADRGAEALSAVDDAVADDLGCAGSAANASATTSGSMTARGAASSRAHNSASSGSSSDSLRLLDPAFATSTRTSAISRGCRAPARRPRPVHRARSSRARPAGRRRARG
jgi:hypothetical protein